jgi:hypothetical protein
LTATLPFAIPANRTSLCGTPWRNFQALIFHSCNLTAISSSEEKQFFIDPRSHKLLALTEENRPCWRNIGDLEHLVQRWFFYARAALEEQSQCRHVWSADA